LVRPTTLTITTYMYLLLRTHPFSLCLVSAGAGHWAGRRDGGGNGSREGGDHLPQTTSVGRTRAGVDGVLTIERNAAWWTGRCGLADG